jgi:hypothetical protein
VDIVEEVGHERVEFLRLVGHGGGEVVLFGEVFGEVEEFEAVLAAGFDEFEVAQAEGGLGCTGNGVVEDEERVLTLDMAPALVVKDAKDAAAIDIVG